MRVCVCYVTQRKCILFSILRFDTHTGVIISGEALFIRPVNKRHLGNYSCEASNVQGTSASQVIRLSVRCKTITQRTTQSALLDFISGTAARRYPFIRQAELQRESKDLLRCCVRRNGSSIVRSGRESGCECYVSLAHCRPQNTLLDYIIG